MNLHHRFDGREAAPVVVLSNSLGSSLAMWERQVPVLTERLITQMYFPDDPLFPFDPIYNSVRDEQARRRMIASFELGLTVPNWAHGYRWDIVLGGRYSTPMEH